MICPLHNISAVSHREGPCKQNTHERVIGKSVSTGDINSIIYGTKLTTDNSLFYNPRSLLDLIICSLLFYLHLKAITTIVLLAVGIGQN